MITWFFIPEGNMSFNLTPAYFSFMAESSKIWLGFSFAPSSWSPWVLVPRSSLPFLNSCVLFLFLPPYRAFRNPACLAGLNTICDILCNFKYHSSSVFNNKSCYGFYELGEQLTIQVTMLYLVDGKYILESLHFPVPNFSFIHILIYLFLL